MRLEKNYLFIPIGNGKLLAYLWLILGEVILGLVSLSKQQLKYVSKCANLPYILVQSMFLHVVKVRPTKTNLT